MNDEIIQFEGNYGKEFDGKYMNFVFSYENPTIHSFETHITENSVKTVF